MLVAAFGRLQCLLVLLIRHQQFSVLALLGRPGIQGIVHFMPGAQYRLPIRERGGFLPCFVQGQTLGQPPALKDRQVNRRADGKESRVPTVQIATFEGLHADSPFEADTRVEIGLGHTDGRRGGMQLRLGVQDVGAPVGQPGRDADRHVGRQRRQGHGGTQLRIEGARLFAQQQRQGIHQAIATLAQFGNRSLDRCRLRAGGRCFEARRDAVTLAAFGQAEGSFGHRQILLRDVQLRLGAAQLQIGSRHFGGQGHPGGFAVIHRGLQGRCRTLAHASRTAPKIELPTGIETQLPEIARAGGGAQCGKLAMFAERLTCIAGVGGHAGQQLRGSNTQLRPALLNALGRHVQIEVARLGS